MSEERSGDGGGKEFARVLEELRNRIITEIYPLDSALPPQRALAEEFGVSRDTVQRVVKALVAEGRIESRQGSGSRVVKTQRIQPAVPQDTTPRPRTLGPIMTEAFSRPEVGLDVFTLTGESLVTHVRLQNERMRRELRRTPQRITMRVLVPSGDAQLPFPRAKDDPADPRPAKHVRAIVLGSTTSLRNILELLRVHGIVAEVDLQIRYTTVVPNFKFYLLNGSEALFGLYQVVDRPIMLADGEVLPAMDVEGVGANLMHYVSDEDPNSPGSFFVDSMQTYFDSLWSVSSDVAHQGPGRGQDRGV
ncbi:winged helix-turn-helix domain-containing protein [Streptomyces sp. NBC_00414]|uniref:winged helix-turn-helix domain-containing protein n=1 Tax=Streptomyces sp. NBC_00414 TaxID=2975739 RepID=UPI002E208E44